MKAFKLLFIVLFLSSVNTIIAQQIITDNSQNLEALIQANANMNLADNQGFTALILRFAQVRKLTPLAIVGR